LTSIALFILGFRCFRKSR